MNNDKGVFILTLKNLYVGVFYFAGDGYVTFTYSEEFKNQNKYHTVPNFPILNKIYKSSLKIEKDSVSGLFPFLVARLPSIKRLHNQPELLNRLKQGKGDENSVVDRLRIFGKRSINNPYVLTYKELNVPLNYKWETHDGYGEIPMNLRLDAGYNLEIINYHLDGYKLFFVDNIGNKFGLLASSKDLDELKNIGHYFQIQWVYRPLVL